MWKFLGYLNIIINQIKPQHRFLKLTGETLIGFINQEMVYIQTGSPVNRN